MECQCPEGFSGSRCESRAISKKGRRPQISEKSGDDCESEYISSGRFDSMYTISLISFLYLSRYLCPPGSGRLSVGKGLYMEHFCPRIFFTELLRPFSGLSSDISFAQFSILPPLPPLFPFFLCSPDLQSQSLSSLLVYIL